MAPNRIFISHSSRDAHEAEQLVSYLESRGLSCWLAPRDIPGASAYAEALVDGIDGADLMVVLLSEHANHSQHVIREINRAVDKRKAILPVQMGTFDLSKAMQYYLSHTQWLVLDAGVSFEEGLPEIEAAVLRPAARRKEKGASPRPVIVRRRSPLGFTLLGAFLAALVLLAGLWYGGGGMVLGSSSRLTPEQNNALRELVAYEQMHLAAFNEMLESMRHVYQESRIYLAGKMSEDDWAMLDGLLGHTMEKISGLSAKLRPLADTAAGPLSKTAVSVADARELHTAVGLERDSSINTLEFLRSCLAPGAVISRERTAKILDIYDKMLDETAKALYFGICELALPVLDTDAIREFRSEGMRYLTFFDASYGAYWNSDAETLKNAQNQALERLERLQDEYGALVGNMDVTLDFLRASAADIETILDQVLSDWSRLDAHVTAISAAVAPAVLDSIAAFWNGSETVSPSMRVEHHREMCKALEEALRHAAAVPDSGVFTQTLLGLCDKNSIPSDAVRPLYEGFDTVREKYGTLLERITSLIEASTRPDVERQLREIRGAVSREVNWAGAAHLSGLRLLMLLPPQLQEKSAKVLGGFTTLRPTAIPGSVEVLDQFEAEVQARISKDLEERRLEVETSRAYLDEVTGKLEEARGRLREKCRIMPEDDAGMVIGKALQLRAAGLVHDALAAFKQYGELFGAMEPGAGEHLAPETTEAYVRAATLLTRHLADYGIEGGAFVFGFQDCVNPAPLRKYDVIIQVDSRPVKDADAFFLELKAAKEAGQPVQIGVLRFSGIETPQPEIITYVPDRACLVGVVDI